MCSFPNGRDHNKNPGFPAIYVPCWRSSLLWGFNKWLFQVVYNLNLSIVLVYIECLGLRWMSTKHSFGTLQENSTLPKTNIAPEKGWLEFSSFLSGFTLIPRCKLLVSGSVTGKLWGDSKVYRKRHDDSTHPFPPTSPRLSLTEQKQGDLRFVAWKVYTTWVVWFYCWWQPEIRRENQRKDGARTLDK